MNDNNQDRSHTEGQSGLDRETEQRNRENETGEAQKQPAGKEGGSGFVGSGKEDSSDYLTKDEQEQDLTVQDTSPASSDIETGQAADRESDIDDGSDSNR